MRIYRWPWRRRRPIEVDECCHASSKHGDSVLRVEGSDRIKPRSRASSSNPRPSHSRWYGICTSGDIFSFTSWCILASTLPLLLLSRLLLQMLDVLKEARQSLEK